MIERNCQSAKVVSHLLKEMRALLQPQVAMLLKVKAKMRREMIKRIPKRILTRKKKINLKRNLPRKTTKTSLPQRMIPKKKRKKMRSLRLLRMHHIQKKRANAPLKMDQVLRLEFHPLRLMKLVN